MNIKELKEAIKDLPDDMVVCGQGYYSQPLDIYDIRSGKLQPNSDRKNDFRGCIIDMESKGEEPE